MDLKLIQKDPFNVLSSTLPVVEQAQSVKINEQKIDEVAAKVIARFEQGLYSHDEGYGSTGDLEKDLQLVFIEDAVNFCFWPNKGESKWAIEWPQGNTTSGGWFTLIACFKRTLAEDVPILDAKYLSEITLEQARHSFRGVNNTKIPLLQERVEIFHQVGKTLLEKFDGKIINLIEQSNYQAENLLKSVLENFPSFRDVSIYEDREVKLLKRAQIFAYDLSFPLKKANKEISGLEFLTSFADYKLPQILRMFGVFEYTPDLAERVDNFVEINHDSKEEVEIRSSTIWAVELLRQKIQTLTASQIDLTLWLLSQDIQDKAKPYHRTRTTYY